MIKPGTIFNMQMHGHFPMCAIIPYTEQSYYVLNLETSDIDFKGSLDEINNEIQSRRHKIIVTTEDIKKQDYILTPGRYVGIEEQEDDGEPFQDKMKRLTSELSEMFAQSNTLQDEIKKNLASVGFEMV